MPFKSEKQRAKMYSMLSEKKISKSVIDKFEAETPKDKPLPEYVSSRKPKRKSLKELIKRK